MNTESTIREIRPEAEPLDADWSALTLREITRVRPRTRRPRRGLKALAVTTVAVLGTGTAAYAAGLVPDFIADQFEPISTSQVHDVRRVASFDLPAAGGARTFDVWRAANDRGQTCHVAYEAQGRFGPSFDGACGPDPEPAWFGWTSEAWRSSEPEPDATLYVYGEPGDPGVRGVRVRAAGFVHAAEVDPDTGGYAVGVPEVTRSTWTERAGQVVAVVDFLDERGDRIGRHVVRDR